MAARQSPKKIVWPEVDAWDARRTACVKRDDGCKDRKCLGSGGRDEPGWAVV